MAVFITAGKNMAGFKYGGFSKICNVIITFRKNMAGLNMADFPKIRQINPAIITPCKIEPFPRVYLIFKRGGGDINIKILPSQTFCPI